MLYLNYSTPNFLYQIYLLLCVCIFYRIVTMKTSWTIWSILTWIEKALSVSLTWKFTLSIYKQVRPGAFNAGTIWLFILFKTGTIWLFILYV